MAPPRGNGNAAPPWRNWINIVQFRVHSVDPVVNSALHESAWTVREISQSCMMTIVRAWAGIEAHTEAALAAQLPTFRHVKC